MQHLPRSRGGTSATILTAALWSGLAAALATAQLPGSPLHGVPLAIGLLTLAIAAIVATFSLRYMRTDARRGRFFASLAALAGTVFAFVITGNLMLFGAAWCASGWLLAALIGHSREWSEARAAAQRARRAFVAGDLALVCALALLGWQAGSVEMDAVFTAVGAMPPAVVATAALLLAVAALARCATPPFAGWLLSSMTAPTPVSALMHAGFVNAGGFLLIRFAPVLEAAPVARIALVAAGLAGAIHGIGIMMVRPDIKRALAGSTVSQMGFMLMSCGLGAYGAALWHIVAHGLFKAWLFLGSGSAVGMKPEARPAPLPTAACGAIAAATVALAVTLTASGRGGAGMVPLLLALATALATLAASLAGRLALRAKLTLVAALAALALFHAAGLTLAHAAAGADGPALLPDWALLALLVAFLGGWVWQQHRLATGRGLPLWLYVHLINAGALRTPAKGV